MGIVFLTRLAGALFRQGRVIDLNSRPGGAGEHIPGDTVKGDGMVYDILWHGLGCICLAGIAELVILLLRDLRGVSVPALFLGVLMGVLCSAIAAGAVLYPALFTDYYAFFVEKLDPTLRLVLFPLALLVPTLALAFLSGRVFRKKQMRTVVACVALICSTAAVFWPIGFDWLQRGRALVEPFFS